MRLKDLEEMVTSLNKLLGRPLKPYIDNKAQIGNFHLSESYGSIALHEMINEDGGIRTVFSLTSKKDLGSRIGAMMLGLGLYAGTIIKLLEGKYEDKDNG